MPDTVESAPPRATRPAAQVRPIAFERARVWEALRSHRGLLLLALLLGLFGGALVSRLSVRLDHRAEAVARVADGASAAVGRVLDDDVLASARTLSGFEGSTAELRREVTVAARPPRDLVITAHGADADAALRLADGLTAAFVAREGTVAQRRQGEAQAAHTAALDAARRELAHVSLERAEALAAEGVADPELELATVRTRLSELDRELADARVQLGEAAARGSVYRAEQRGQQDRGAAGELAEAQRALSLLLAQRAEDDPEVKAQRGRIQRLQARLMAPTTQALGNRAEARAQAARLRELELDRGLLVLQLEQLSRTAARLSPFHEAHEQARARLASLEAQGEQLARPPAAEVAVRARSTGVAGKTLRAAVALFAPLLALLVVVCAVVLRELRDFRVSAATELAHWLSVPVLASSPWPARESALDGLVDTLFDGATEASGTTLVVPMSESERPLAHTLSARINGRAQRHFRSATGARITLAQSWEGELSGSRLKRAAEVADRVLWIVAADQYHGKDLAQRADVLGRLAGVAAVLVEAPEGRLDGAVGDPVAFWGARSESRSAEKSVPPARVPVH